MKHVIENIAEDNGWAVFYGRTDFHNLYDGEDDDKILIFLDPIAIDKTFDNVTERVDGLYYTAKMLISVSSNLDTADYQTRYDNHIKPLVDNAFKIITEHFECNFRYSITSYSILEVINSGDYNVDGIAVNMKVRDYEPY